MPLRSSLLLPVSCPRGVSICNICNNPYKSRTYGVFKVPRRGVFVADKKGPNPLKSLSCCRCCRLKGGREGKAGFGARKQDPAERARTGSVLLACEILGPLSAHVQAPDQRGPLCGAMGPLHLGRAARSWAGDRPYQRGAITTTGISGQGVCVKRNRLVADHIGNDAYEKTRNIERNTKMADREGSGTLGRNKRKTAPTHADYSGSFTLDGKKHWINAWLKEAKDDDGVPRKFFSLSVRRADPPKASANGNAPLIGDEIPFAPETR